MRRTTAAELAVRELIGELGRRDFLTGGNPALDSGERRAGRLAPGPGGAPGNARAVVLALLLAVTASCGPPAGNEYRSNGLSLRYSEEAALSETPYPGPGSPVGADAGRIEIQDGDFVSSVLWQRRPPPDEDDLIAELEESFRAKEAEGLALLDLEGKARGPRHEHRSAGRYYAEVPESARGLSGAAAAAQTSLTETAVWWCDVSQRMFTVTTTGPPDDIHVSMDGAGPQRTSWDDRRMREAHRDLLRSVDCHPE